MPDHLFRLRPSDTFTVGATKVTLASIQSSRRVTLTIGAGDAATRLPLAVGTPWSPEPGITLALDPNTSRPSMVAVIVVSTPEGLEVQPPH